MLGLYAMAALYILAGLNHFRAPRVYRPLMPPWIPQHDLMIFLSGICEVGLGGLLLWAPTQALAAWGIIAMLIVFFVVHIYMYQLRKTKFKNIPMFVIVARLPLQLVLIYWAYLYT
jgi:uncharacterized membrane protein